MTENGLFVALAKAETIGDVERALDAFEDAAGESIAWVPVGGRPNNRGTIEVSGNTGRAIVERVTNGIDAVLEHAHDEHDGRPDCRSPREAATAWLNVPEDGVSKLTRQGRQKLAERVVVTLFPGDGPNLRTIDVTDSGIGLGPDEMPRTILSLNESNKIQKHYLAGTYGQGGSATFAASRYTLIASRKGDADAVAYTVVKYLDLPPEQYKTGHYVYLTSGGRLLLASGHKDLLGRGTKCRHFGYDLSKFTGSLGPGSVYGLLQQVLFDPVLPIWLDNKVHGWRRVIKGSRNALKGAVDEGDESSRGPNLSHSQNMGWVSLGEFGRIGIEYWVLADDTKRPSASYIDPRRPIILTLNGQNQAELTQAVIREAELPYLAKRLIVHVDCNALTPGALRALFVSNREDARAGVVKDLIQREVVQALRTDDILDRLNKEARESTLRQRDEAAEEETRKEVARILKVQGYDLDLGLGGGGGEGAEPSTTQRPRGPRPKPAPIELHEPPTFIRIVGKEEDPIRFWPSQRRYIRVETDANGHYHNAKDLKLSKVNVVIDGRFLSLAGTTPLEGGRMRLVVDCGGDAGIGQTGTLRVELTRTGLATLSDQRGVEVVKQPEAREKKQKMPLPRFKFVPVEGPEDPNWTERDWPENISAVASSAIKNEGILYIYYSTVYPKYVTQLRRLEAKDPSLAASFTKRYEIWLAVHSLILDDELNRKDEPAEGEPADPEEWERKERCRFATISAMFASKEALFPDAALDDSA